MDINTQQRENELNREIDNLNTDLRELEKGCGIQVT